MHGVLERRREYLRLMRQLTVENGFFTVSDFQVAAQVPRSTAQDWINRLSTEGCVMVRRAQSGRAPARYVSRSVIPQSACRRVFTTIDGELVEIFHECMSGACAAFCGHHHSLAKGPLVALGRDGTLLRERARVGEYPVSVGPSPEPAVGVSGIRIEDGFVIQRIRSIGGPAYSLTDMMSRAEGVLDVSVSRKGMVVEAEIRTRALVHLTIGLDDTDTQNDGATFALAIALLQYLSGVKGVFPIGHHIVMLYPGVPNRTAGNSCSLIEVATPREMERELVGRATDFISRESFSSEWGIATRSGFLVPVPLQRYGLLARSGLVTSEEAGRVAQENGVLLSGGKGRIGALAAVALSGMQNEVLLDPSVEIVLGGGVYSA